tara:strand:- start:101707 stop:102657 length:951 start_codon:yes stop_codon:yes gene_type:complete
VKKVYLAGHEGMVGSAILRSIRNRDIFDIVTATHKELDLTNQLDTRSFINKHKPDLIIISAAKVGGIVANSLYPADFLYINILIQSNLIQSAFSEGVSKLLFLGSSCIYPKFSLQPIKEEYLLSGKLEPTNEPYAIAKISGLKLCEAFNIQHDTDYRSLMPTNLYGPSDTYHDQDSHVIPALIKRFHEAKLRKTEKVSVWGSGSPKREFLYVDDLANACIDIINIDKADYWKKVPKINSHINIGTGEDISIKDLSKKIASTVNYKGKIDFDESKPDGTPRKLLNIDMMKSFGIRPKVLLDNGLNYTYQDYLKNYLK